MKAQTYALHANRRVTGARLAAVAMPLLLAVTGCLPAGVASEMEHPASLSGRRLDVHDFHYQLQEADLDSIGRTAYDLIVLDYSADGTQESAYDAVDIMSLQTSAGGPKVVLAYLSIGEAEDYRFYWDPSWDLDGDGEPEASAPGWLEAENPAWPGNYRVRYWERAWQRIVFGEDEAYLDRILAAGFDGVYLDRVDAYEWFEARGRLTAAEEMVDLVLRLASYAREQHPGFLVIPQNAGELAGRFREYLAAVDGIGQEDIYYGYPDDGVPSPAAFVSEVERHLDLFVEAGKIVLVTAYTTDPAQVVDHIARCRARGYVPFASTRALNRLTPAPGE